MVWNDLDHSSILIEQIVWNKLEWLIGIRNSLDIKNKNKKAKIITSQKKDRQGKKDIEGFFVFV